MKTPKKKWHGNRVPRFAWITISKETHYVRIERRRRDLTPGSPYLDGPFKVNLAVLAEELRAASPRAGA